MDLTKNKSHPISLYKCGKPTWLEHPSVGENIDVVALRIEIPSNFFVTAFSKEDCISSDPNMMSIHVPIGDDILVVGYPDGLYDSIHNIPIFRSGSLASLYPLQYLDNYYFLIDSCLHKGTSGSPVLLKPSRLIQTDKSGCRHVIDYPKKRYLIGIHSGELDKTRKYLNLSTVWFAELIQEIIEG